MQDLEITSINSLRGLVGVKKQELRELEERARKIPRLREAIVQIEKTIQLIEGGEMVEKDHADSLLSSNGNGSLFHENDSSVSFDGRGHVITVKTLENFAEDAITQIGGEVNTEQLVEKMKLMGCFSEKQSILGAVYRAIKNNPNCKIYKVRSGVFAIKKNALSVAS